MIRLLSFFFAFIITLQVSGQSSNAEDSFYKYFETNADSLNPIEGIWQVSITRETYHYDTLFDVSQDPVQIKIAVRKNNQIYKAFRMSSASFDVEFLSTDVKGVYLYRNFFPDIGEYSKNHAVICKSDEMEYTYDIPEDVMQSDAGYNFSPGKRVVNVLKWKKIFPAKKSTK